MGDVKNPSDLPVGNVPQWTLGDRLRKARQTAGIDIADMADDVGCTPRTISNYELDATRVPKLVIKQYALRTRVPYAWLIGGNFRPEPIRRTITDEYPPSTLPDLRLAA